MDIETVEQGYRQHEDGIGYDVYHSTRGWRCVCAQRVKVMGV